MDEINGRSRKASDSEVVEHACQLIGRLLEQLEDGVDAVLVEEDVVGRPGFEVVDVLLLGEGEHEVGLLAVHLFEDCLEGVLGLVGVVVVELVHVEGKVGQHLVVELIEDLVLEGVFAPDLPQHIPEGHEHPALAQHLPDLPEDRLAREEVQRLPHCYQVEFLLLAQIHYMALRKHNRVRGVALLEFLHVRRCYGQHLLAEVDAFGLLEVFAKAQQDFACADCDVQVPFFVGKGVNGVAAELLRVVRAIFLIVEALSLEIPDVHVQTIGLYYDNWNKLSNQYARPNYQQPFSIVPARKAPKDPLIAESRRLARGLCENSNFYIPENVCTGNITELRN